MAAASSLSPLSGLTSGGKTNACEEKVSRLTPSSVSLSRGKPFIVDKILWTRRQKPLRDPQSIERRENSSRMIPLSKPFGVAINRDCNLVWEVSLVISHTLESEVLPSYITLKIRIGRDPDYGTVVAYNLISWYLVSRFLDSSLSATEPRTNNSSPQLRLYV